MDTPDTPKPARRRYSDAEQADYMAKLASNGGDVARTALETGVPKATLQKWKYGERRPPRDPLLYAEKKDALARGIGRLARRVLRRVLDVADDEERPVSLRDGTVALGICVDKLQQLHGDAPGSHTVNVNVNAVSVTLTPDDITAARALLASAGPAPALAPRPEPLDLTPAPLPADDQTTHDA